MRSILFLSLALAAATTHAAAIDDAAQALDAARQAGYTAPYGLEFQHGYWTLEATTREGLNVDVLVDPANGQVRSFDSHGTGAISSVEVRNRVLAAGYVKVRDIEFDDGFWEAEAVDTYGREIDLILHPITGVILNAPQEPTGTRPLTASEITTRLTAAGYSRIHDLEFDDGYWETDATNAGGERVEIRINPTTGIVVREQLDD